MIRFYDKHEETDGQYGRHGRDLGEAIREDVCDRLRDRWVRADDARGGDAELRERLLATQEVLQGVVDNLVSHGLLSLNDLEQLLPNPRKWAAVRE